MKKLLGCTLFVFCLVTSIFAEILSMADEAGKGHHWTIAVGFAVSIFILWKLTEDKE